MTYVWTNVTTDQAVTPKLHFVGAILHQAAQDAQSPRKDVRKDAVAFWSNPACLQYWEDFLGLQDGALQQNVRNVLREGG